MVNAVGIQHMLRLAADWKVSAFVFVSSASVIGTPKFVPITEDHRCEPLTVYHASKLFGEYATAIATRSGMAACSLRITSPAGPGTPGERFISILVQRAVAGLPLELHGRGTRRQNYVDVRDVAYAVSLCLENLPTGTFNIAGQSISNCDLASLVIKTLGSPSQIRFTSQRDPADLLDWTFSTQSAEATFGFRVQYQLEDSVTAIAKELREHAV
jgi:UDP-glucose 4-epimerase